MKKENFFIGRERRTIGYFPAFYTHSYLLEKRCGEKYGHSVKKLVFIVDGDTTKFITITLDDFQKIGQLMLDKVLKNKVYVKNLRKESHTAAKRLLNFCQKRDLVELNNKELIKKYFAYSKLYTDFCFVNVPSWYILGETLNSYLQQQNWGITDYTILCSPMEPSFAFREECGRLRIIKKISQDKKLIYIFITKSVEKIERELQKNYPRILSNIKKHGEEYYWIPWDYLGTKLYDEKYFITEIKNYLQSDKNIKEEFSQLKNYHKELKKKQYSIKISKKLFRLFQDLQQLAILQDIRKEVCTESHIYYQLYLLQEISSRTKIPRDLLIFMLEEEVKKSLEGKKFDIDKLRERKILSVLTKDESGYQLFLGKEALKFRDQYTPIIKDMKEIKGQAASPGIVKGIVRILIGFRNIDNVQNGDVLVTTMTTPDYLPAMKKAVAFVTDEGGITCHASIVAREMKKPCIIGTKTATKILKDGDLVEVDADNGIVRILKKAETKTS